MRTKLYLYIMNGPSDLLGTRMRSWNFGEWGRGEGTERHFVQVGFQPELVHTELTV
jgi:hypothetical protein